MQVYQLSQNTDMKQELKKLGVDSGGVNILASKAKHFSIYIKDLPVGGANILKQDALSIGADLAVPRGTVIAATPKVDCILIATARELEILSKKELVQPFGLKSLALELQKILKIKKPQKTEIMGVINANDDSFFRGSRFKSSDAIVKIEQMIEDGADIIDIGAVSSRPNAPKVSVYEELERISPILKIIKEEKLHDNVKFSCDSYEPIVLSRALESGFSIVNDITGFSNDEVCKLTAQYNARAIIMHMQGRPETMQENPKYENILHDIYSFLEQKIQKTEAFGIKDIVLDVGIGFGKTLHDNLMLIKHLEYFLGLNKALLIGASRKSMIDKISSSKVEDRLGGTLALHMEAVTNGASMLRVHDVYEHVQALKVLEALRD